MSSYMDFDYAERRVFGMNVIDLVKWIGELNTELHAHVPHAFELMSTQTIQELDLLSAEADRIRAMEKLCGPSSED